MGTTIQVSEEVYERLKDLKERGEHSSFDSVIRELLNIMEKAYSYWAGIIDGEGCITIAKQVNYGKKKRSPNYILILDITNTSKELLEEAKKFFGVGSVRKRWSNEKLKEFREQGRNISQIYQFRADRRSALKILRAVLPYLRLKRPQAELAIEYMNSVVNYSGKVIHNKKGFEEIPEEELKKREQFYLMMRELNKKHYEKFGESEVERI